VVLLKGRHTLVVEPAGRVRATTTGVPWLATAGAGDVLGGLVGALLAAGLDPFDAASVGSWLHGAAATLASGGGPIVASEVARHVAAVVRELPSRV
jgi:NAD(P)H-hydrate repair Nnr-like enzyme with NAD(P)H-hydrate dehydratase domain